jgi:hypothetical protein
MQDHPLLLKYCNFVLKQGFCSHPRKGVWQGPVSSSFGRKPFQTLKQDSESPFQSPSLPHQRQINGEPASSTIPTWFEDWERATLEDLPVSAKMNSFYPSEIERIHLPKECKRLIIRFGYLSIRMNHLKEE